MNDPGLWDERLVFAVLRKANRLQVLVHPTPNQLRRRKKRSWTMVEALPLEGYRGRKGLPKRLTTAIMQALSAMHTEK